MSRIVFTVATGNRKYAEQALGLARSLRLIGDRTPRVLLTDLDDPAFTKNFDEIVRPREGVPTYLLKLEALLATDADEMLFIDSDSLAFRRLDPVFDAGAHASVAVQGEWVSDGHWYGWLELVLPKLGLSALPRFNGGMIYYSRSPETQRLFEAVHEVARNYDETGLERFRGTVPDEPCLSIAMAKTGIGLLLPDTRNFMNTPVGLVGRLEMDVMRNRCQFLKHSRYGLRLIRPSILHAGKYVNNTIYWKQLSKLEWLERYEQAHPFGYMSGGHKLRRSVERCILQASGKL